MNNDKLDDLFSSLSDSASTLNNYSDSCNKKLKYAQERLSSLNIGLEYWLEEPIFRGDQTGNLDPHKTSIEKIKRLGFSRLSSHWVLAVKTVRCVSGFYQGDMSCPYTNEYVDDAPEPLLDSSREIRLAALKALPEFLAKYNDLVQELNSELSNS